MHPPRPSSYFYTRSKYPLGTVQFHVIHLCKQSIQVFPISSQNLETSLQRNISYSTNVYNTPIWAGDCDLYLFRMYKIFFWLLYS